MSGQHLKEKLDGEVVKYNLTGQYIVIPQKISCYCICEVILVDYIKK